jgi:group I intron endonuclease
MAERILSNSGIYTIRNTANGKMYVGSALNIVQRKYGHKSRLLKGTHHSSKLQAAWIKHGEQAFVFEVLELVDSLDRLIEREQHWIDFYCACGVNGYNMRPIAHSSLGVKLSDSAKAKKSAALKGKPLSKEHKAKISAGLSGHVLSEETRRKISEAHAGKPKGPFSDETRAKMSAAKAGKKRGPMSAEHRAILSAAHMGRKTGTPSDETRAKISAAKKEGFRRRREAAALLATA